MSEAKNELLHLLDQQEASEEALSDATDALDTIRNRIARLEDQYKREKEGMEATVSERQREQEQMEGDLDELRLDGAAEIERRQREQHKVVAELRAEAEDQHQECEGEYRRVHENILNALGQLADYKEHVQRRLAETSGELLGIGESRALGAWWAPITLSPCHLVTSSPHHLINPLIRVLPAEGGGHGIAGCDGSDGGGGGGG